MLTADLVDARKKDGELLLRMLDAEGRAEAMTLSAALLDAARALVGKRREELDEAWDGACSEEATKRFKLAAGLRKLVADACSFEAEASVDPVELRRVLFKHASEVRRTRGEGERFDRDAVVAEAARTLGLDAAVVERAMFADLKGEHLLQEPPTLDAASVVEAWELGQAQAVLLAAVRVTCQIESASPGPARAFFAKLKFHKLLFSVERIESGWRVVIDGPYSMFDSVTKYGLRLAFVLPALRALERWSLVADIRWGKAREPLVFRLSSDSGLGAAAAAAAAPSRRGDKRGRGGKASKKESPVELHLSDEVRELATGIDALESGWNARPTTALLDVPGHGICIPDLELTNPERKRPVYVEVLGYWSRDAVFRRVELAERGLGAPIVFAVSSRLRVSAEVLDEAALASLYVYKGKMSPRAVIERASRLG
jgi:predicted nuclease of restriction endonuclease-like RecB superfamily